VEVNVGGPGHGPLAHSGEATASGAQGASSAASDIVVAGDLNDNNENVNIYVKNESGGNNNEDDDDNDDEALGEADGPRRMKTTCWLVMFALTVTVAWA
jgi:hypothetical protein